MSIHDTYVDLGAALRQGRAFEARKAQQELLFQIWNAEDTSNPALQMLFKGYLPERDPRTRIFNATHGTLAERVAMYSMRQAGAAVAHRPGERDTAEQTLMEVNGIPPKMIGQDSLVVLENMYARVATGAGRLGERVTNAVLRAFPSPLRGRTLPYEEEPQQTTEQPADNRALGVTLRGIITENYPDLAPEGTFTPWDVSKYATQGEIHQGILPVHLKATGILETTGEREDSPQLWGDQRLIYRVKNPFGR